MFTEISKNWWLFLVRGLVAVVFGMAALFWPTQTWLALVVMFGAFVLLDGIITTVAGIEFRLHFDRWWAVVLEGVLGIVIGLMTLISPNPISHVLFYVIATWAVVTGILEIVASIHFRSLIPGEWSMVLSGFLSLVFGILLFVYPSAGLVGLVWAIGFYAFAFGTTQFVFAFRLHDLNKLINASNASGI